MTFFLLFCEFIARNILLKEKQLDHFKKVYLFYTIYKLILL